MVIRVWYVPYAYDHTIRVWYAKLYHTRMVCTIRVWYKIRVWYRTWTLKLLDKALYSKSIAGRGVARLISWLGTAGPVDCFNRVFDCYNIRVYIQSFNFYWSGTGNFWFSLAYSQADFLWWGKIPISTVQLFPRCV